MNITGTVNAGMRKMADGMKNGVNNCKVDGKIAEQQKRISEIKDLEDDEIDYSDIPPLTKEELKKMKPARLRKQKQNIAS